ncbi:STAS domain-containing protein [Streptomyces sp. NPDC054842]
MSLSVREAGGSTVIAVRGEVDMDNAGQLEEAITSAARARPGAVVLDLSEVTFADSTTVNILLRCYGALGTRLRPAALSAYMDRLLTITGVSEALSVYGTVAEALEAVDPGQG